jgi:hypothetical protein
MHIYVVYLDHIQNYTELEKIFCQGVTLLFQIVDIMNFISNENESNMEFIHTK